MSEDELLNFSGEVPEDVRPLLTGSEPELELLNSTISTILHETTQQVITTTTTPQNILEYEPNPFRIGFLAFKCILIILLFTLSCTIRRDFLKFFVLFLIVPLFIEAGFDIFTEIHASTAIFGIEKFNWQYFNLQPYQNDTVTDWQKHAVESYGKILAKYTTYQLYTSDELFSITSYILGDFIFWSLLFSTTTVYFFAHKAIVRPEQVAYEPIGTSFAKVQLLPILFTTVDTLLSIFEVPSYVYLPAMVVIRLTACVAVLSIVTHIFASLFLFCRRKDEITKASPYEQVRNSKMRLFLFVLFTLIINILTAPYIIWSALSLAYDVGQILSFDWYLPLHFAYELYPLHLTFFIVRPYAILILSLIFLNSYRRRFVKFFCPCCKRH